VIPGALLAAGLSRRMGRSKALLPAGRGGQTFVARLAAVLAAGGIDDVLIVGRPGDLALRAAAMELGAVRYVSNPRADEGQISSILAALAVADRPGVEGLLVLPVDQPLVTPETVASLLAGFRRVRPPVARATHGGAHGHPVIFARAVFDELRRVAPGDGARAVVRAHGASVLDVEVPDEGVLIDIDDPEEYARIFGVPRLD
jgi:CTP:molybdopterin cytidylyltransferase MocA